MSFVKLDCGILDSSVWSESAETVKVWITLLAMARPNGVVEATAPGIARRAQLPLEVVVAALEVFETPDRHSRSIAAEGRRLERVDGGYRVLNYLTYRAKDYTAADRQRRRRRKLTPTESVGVTRDNVTRHAVSHKQKREEAEAKQTKEEASGRAFVREGVGGDQLSPLASPSASGPSSPNGEIGQPGSGNGDNGVPDPDPDHQLRQAITHDPNNPTDLAIVERCVQGAKRAAWLEDRRPTQADVRLVLEAVSATPAGVSIDSGSLINVREAWKEQTLRACEAFEADHRADGAEPSE